MCNRHVAHMIAEYEAARLDRDKTVKEPADERFKPTDSEPELTAQKRFLASLLA